MAQRNRVRVAEITLWFFGGVAKLEGDADDPGAEFRIALAGPAMSALTALAAGARPGPAGGSAPRRSSWACWCGCPRINTVLAVSNLLPAFPLDGGRILRAVLWRRMARKIRATRVAALWGQILAGGDGRRCRCG